MRGRLSKKTFCGGIRLVRTHENLPLKRTAVVTQDTVDTVPGIPFLVKTANLSLS